MSRSGGWVVATVALLAPCLAGAQDSLVPFQVDTRSNDDVSATGVVTATAGQTLFTTVATTPRDILLYRGHGRLTVHQFKSGDDGLLAAAPPGDAPTSFESDDLRVTVPAGAAPFDLLAWAATDEAQSRIGDAACSLASEATVTFHFHGVEARGPTSQRSVVASCEGRLVVTGRYSLALFDAAAQVTVPGQEAKLASSGEFILESGERVLRVIVITTLGVASTDLEEPLKLVSVRSTTLEVEAKLALPRGPGLMRWGAWGQAAKFPATPVEGRFRMDALGEGLRFAGHAAPPVLMSQEVGVPPRLVDLALVVVAAGVALVGGFLALRAPVVALFTRLNEVKALENETRRLILELVRLDPGIRIQDVARQTQMTWAAAEHHVLVLCRQGLLTCLRDEGQTALFVLGALGPDAQRRARILRRDGVQRLMRALREQPDASQADLARLLDVRQSYVSHLLRVLAGVGAVRVEARGRGNRYVPTE